MSTSNLTGFPLPEHPLPEEIQRMKRDETVCKFCGVSYLIHNEMKALEERVEEAERQMEYYKGSVEREKILIVKLEEMEKQLSEQKNNMQEQRQQLELFKGDLKMKASLIHEMYSKQNQMKSDLAKSEQNAMNLTEKLSKFNVILPRLNTSIKEQRISMNNLKTLANKEKMLSKNEMNKMKSILNDYIEKMNKEKLSYKKDIEELRKELFESRTKIKQHSVVDGQLNDLNNKRNELENKLIVHEKHASFLEDQSKTLKEKCNVLETELHSKLNETKKLQKDLENVQSERENENIKNEARLSEKEQEFTKLDARCKNLEKLIEEKSISEKQVRNVASGKDEQVKKLQKTLSQIKIESEALKLEREQTIISHHNRIEQLRESYSKKVGETETSYRKLREEFEHQQKIIENDFEEERKEMKNKFQKERDAVNSEHDGQLRALRSEINELNEKLDKENSVCKTQKEELYRLKNDITSNKTKSTQETQKCQNEILELRRQLQDSEERFQQSQEKHQNIVTGNTRFDTLQRSLQEANAQVAALKEQVKKNKSEMNVLQDTVRQECEERLELTQALSNARMQILASGNPGGLRNTPNTKTTSQRLSSRQNNNNMIGKSADFTSNAETPHTSVVNIGHERRTRSTGSDAPRPSRESVDSFRERIALALGRPNRVNITR